MTWLSVLSEFEGPNVPTAQHELPDPQPRPYRMLAFFAVPPPGLGTCWLDQVLPPQISAWLNVLPEPDV